MRRGGRDGNDPVRREFRELHRSLPTPDDDHHDLARTGLHQRHTVQRRQCLHRGPLRQWNVRARVRVPRRDGGSELLPRTRRVVRSTVRPGCQRSLRRLVFRVERGLHAERRHLCVYAGHFVLWCRCRGHVWWDVSRRCHLREPAAYRRPDVPLRLWSRWALWREHLAPPAGVRSGPRLPAKQPRCHRRLRAGDLHPVLCERMHADVGLLRPLHGARAGSVRRVSPGTMCRDSLTVERAQPELRARLERPPMMH